MGLIDGSSAEYGEEGEEEQEEGGDDAQKKQKTDKEWREIQIIRREKEINQLIFC